MTLQSEWSAISARVGGLVDATHVYLAAFIRSGDDPYFGDRSLLDEARSVYAEFKGFRERHGSALPHAALASLARLLDDRPELFAPGAMAGFHAMKVLVPALATARSALDYHLRDFAAVARRITERAIVHLQRCIVADDDLRKKWQSAFETGEPACEKLGAAHLLMHGVWAFKAHSAGERTDLILGEPIGDLSEVERVADALVLTEWKRVVPPEATETVAAVARQQASLYGSGSLAGIELAGYRYIVLVSKDRVRVPQDVGESGVVYRHLGIAVDPRSPSRS